MAVETTTGPLGAGVSYAVGMAIAEKDWPRSFNREGHTVVTTILIASLAMAVWWKHFTKSVSLAYIEIR